MDGALFRRELHLNVTGLRQDLEKADEKPGTFCEPDPPAVARSKGCLTTSFLLCAKVRAVRKRSGGQDSGPHTWLGGRRFENFTE